MSNASSGTSIAVTGTIRRSLCRTAFVASLATLGLAALSQEMAVAKEVVMNCSLEARASTDHATWEKYPTQATVLRVDESGKRIARKDNLDLNFHYRIFKTEGGFIYALYEDSEIKNGHVSVLVFNKADKKYLELSTSSYGQTFLFGFCK